MDHEALITKPTVREDVFVPRQISSLDVGCAFRRVGRLAVSVKTRLMRHVTYT